MKYWKITGVISAALCLLITYQAWADREWVYLESNSSRESFYDKNSIVKVDENVFRLWMKQVLSENGKIKTISKFRNTNKPDNSLDLISYILRQMDVDCRNNQYKDSALIFYDEKSNVLYSSPKGAIGKWDDIVEGSFAYQLKNVICKDRILLRNPLRFYPPTMRKSRLKRELRRKVCLPVLPMKTFVRWSVSGWRPGSRETSQSIAVAMMKILNRKI